MASVIHCVAKLVRASRIAARIDSNIQKFLSKLACGPPSRTPSHTGRRSGAPPNDAAADRTLAVRCLRGGACALRSASAAAQNRASYPPSKPPKRSVSGHPPACSTQTPLARKAKTRLIDFIANLLFRCRISCRFGVPGDKPGMYPVTAPAEARLIRHLVTR